MNNWIGLAVFGLAMLISCIWSYNTIGSIFPSDWKTPTTLTQIQISVFAVLIKIIIDLISQFRIIVYKAHYEKLKIRHADIHILVITIINKGGLNATIHDAGFGNTKGIYIKYFPQYGSEYKELKSYYNLPEFPLTIPKGESKQLKFVIENQWPIEHWQECNRVILNVNDGNRIYLKRKAIDDWFKFNVDMIAARNKALIESFEDANPIEFDNDSETEGRA